MINGNRVRIMAALAAYEKQHKKELACSGKWFRGDYIGLRMLKNGCRVTIAYLICLVFYGVIHFEEVMEALNSMEIQGLAVSILVTYGISLAVYLLATYLVYSIRYYQAEKRRGGYYRLVDRLETEYQRERKGPRRVRRRSGQDRSR